MSPFLAVMAMVGIFTTAYLLGYPIEWTVSRFVMPVLNKIRDKHIEWDEYNRTH